MDIGYKKYLLDTLNYWNEKFERVLKGNPIDIVEVGDAPELFLLLKYACDLCKNYSFLYFMMDNYLLLVIAFIINKYFKYKQDWDKTWTLMEKLLDFSIPEQHREFLENKINSWIKKTELSTLSKRSNGSQWSDVKTGWSEQEVTEKSVFQQTKDHEDIKCDFSSMTMTPEGQSQEKTEQIGYNKIKRLKARAREIPLESRPPRRQLEAQKCNDIKFQRRNELRSLKPEIVCWKRERQWIIAVEVPEDFGDSLNLEVYQNESPLTKDIYNEGSWLLQHAFGKVNIYADDVMEINLGENTNDHLLFKLFGQNQNQGRRVTYPSHGSYLVVVPEKWERDEIQSGQGFPEAVLLSGYLGHFFDIEKDRDKMIAFLTPEGRSVLIKPKAALIELIGTTISDASEKMGTLFIENPPRIRVLNKQGWKDVGAIVVGEEGSGIGKWRVVFAPNQELLEQTLPSEIMNRKGGWYFLRFYDMNDDLVESYDFRFIRDLKGIVIPKLSFLPSENGYKTVSVELIHSQNCKIKPVEIYTGIEIERKNKKTILSIPPEPVYDRTFWFIGNGPDPQTKVNILVERIWWSISEESTIPSEWNDMPVTISRDVFAATSKSAIWIRFPKPRWIENVNVGFEQLKSRKYPLKVNDAKIIIPLRDFGDSQEMQEIGIKPFYLWVNFEGINYTITLFELTIKARCKFCTFDSSTLTEMFDHVISAHIDMIFQSLTYKEMRALIPSLPPGIYKCHYCPKIVRSDDPINPTSAIINHIEEKHRNESIGMGPVSIKFDTISNIEEIRQKVITDLQHIHKCVLCGNHLEEPTLKNMKRHLFEMHLSEICEVV